MRRFAAIPYGDNPPTTPEQRLWFAVIHRALLDWLRDSGSDELWQFIFSNCLPPETITLKAIACMASDSPDGLVERIRHWAVDVAKGNVEMRDYYRGMRNRKKVA